MKRPALMLATLFAASAAQAEPALTSRTTELQEQAQSDAATIATLPESTKVDVLTRKGAWSQVKTTDGQSGWVRMTSLKPEVTAVPAPANANPLGALGNLLSSGRTSNTATVTTGVRGLSEEDLQNAQANPTELEKVQKFGVDRKAAEAFAQRSKLTPAKLDYLPEPAPLSNNEHNVDGG